MEKKEMEDIIKQKDKELMVLNNSLKNCKARCSFLKNEAEKQADIADKCLLTLRNMLTKWTNEALAEKLDKMLGFNPTNKRVEMMGALIEYMYTRERHIFDRELQRTMFKLICKRFDEYKQEQKQLSINY